jgi:hypothetical protein
VVSTESVVAVRNAVVVECLGEGFAEPGHRADELTVVAASQVWPLSYPSWAAKSGRLGGRQGSLGNSQAGFYARTGSLSASGILLG